MEKWSMPQITQTIPEEQWRQYNSIDDWKAKVETLQRESGLTNNQSSLLLSKTKIIPRSKSTEGRYPSNFFDRSQIKLISSLLGFKTDSSLELDINFIRNKLGFPGIVERDYFMTAEVDQILRFLKISTVLSLEQQKKEIKAKLELINKSNHNIIGYQSPRESY